MLTPADWKLLELAAERSATVRVITSGARPDVEGIVEKVGGRHDQGHVQLRHPGGSTNVPAWMIADVDFLPGSGVGGTWYEDPPERWTPSYLCVGCGSPVAAAEAVGVQADTLLGWTIVYVHSGHEDAALEALGVEGGATVPLVDVHKKFPGSDPPRTYCGKPISEDAVDSTGLKDVTCERCRALMGASK